MAPKCECTFGGDDVAVSEQSQTAEGLAGAVGALGTLLVTGGGLGIWHLLRKKTGSADGDSFGRSDSNLSDDSLLSRARDGKGPPPPYGDQGSGFEPSEEIGPRPPNIYRAGMNDTINPWTGEKTTTAYEGAMKDW